MRWEYHVTGPRPVRGSGKQIMDYGDVADWLNEMDEAGWELVGHGEMRWVSGEGAPRTYWVFRRDRKKEMEG